MTISEPESTAIVPAPDGEVMPLPVEQIANMMAQFEEVKRMIAQPGDIVNIKGKMTPVKSFWRRLARAFALSTEILELTINRNEHGKILSADCRARAIHPSGAFSDAYGGASVFEGREWNKDSDIAATAQTRAISRAISDLVAGGALTSDEMRSGSSDNENVEFTD